MRWLAHRLRRFADVIDRHGAPKATGLSFTIEPGLGQVLHYSEGVPIHPPATGCTLWMLNDDAYAKAHSDAGKRRAGDSSVVLRQGAPSEVVMEVRDNRQDRNLLRAWDASGRELTEMERILLDKPPGMATGTCSNPAHASQHPPHVATDEVLGEYWCVGGWVRADGTIPSPKPPCRHTVVEYDERGWGTCRLCWQPLPPSSVGSEWKP